jgi:putative peptidoglycan lipid II flippase
VLNSLHRFAAAAAAPILFNLCQIAALLFAVPYLPTAGHAVAWGVTVSGVLQFLWLVDACRREGIRFRLPRPRLTAEVKRMLALILPAALGAGVTQINILINTVLASFLPSGSISYNYYADRLMELPVGVIGIALGTALLPLLSRQVASGQEAAARTSQNRALELGLFFTLPAAAALIALPFTLISVLFEHGAWGPAETAATGWSLIAYAVGLPAFSVIRVLASGFYARRDTRTPVRFAIITVAVNLAFNFALIWRLGYVGLALSVSLSTWVQALLLGLRLHQLEYWRPDARLLSRIWRSLAASIGMGGGVLLLANLLQPWLSGHGLVRYAAFAAVIAAGLGMYALLAQITGAARLAELRQHLRRDGAGAPASEAG